jgi:hypothetical protein
MAEHGKLGLEFIGVSKDAWPALKPSTPFGQVCNHSLCQYSVFVFNS